MASGHVGAAVDRKRGAGDEPGFVGGQEDTVLALRAGRIAAALLTPPRPLLLQREGFNRIAYSGDYMPTYPSGGIGVTDEKIKSAPNDVLAFVKGRALWPITAMIWLATGFAIWIVGRPGSVQIGASGLIYGLAAFLVATAWFKRDLKSALAALVVIVLYGSIVWGLLPGGAGVSWEGHVSGAVAGILVAVVSAPAKESRLS